jgi:hypothetical protein
MIKEMTAKERKDRPMATGVLDYFPDALAEVAGCSKVGNDQHNPGQPLHWAKGKSTDHADALLRHLADRGTIDSDGVRHSAKVAWRALALLQIELETAGVQADMLVGMKDLPEPKVAVTDEASPMLTPAETAAIAADVSSGRWPYINPQTWSSKSKPTIPTEAPAVAFKKGDFVEYCRRNIDYLLKAELGATARVKEIVNGMLVLEWQKADPRTKGQADGGYDPERFRKINYCRFKYGNPGATGKWEDMGRRHFNGTKFPDSDF